MSSGKLAFLQNFYTDVTLYVPAEPPVASPAPGSSATVPEPAAASLLPAPAPAPAAQAQPAGAVAPPAPAEASRSSAASGPGALPTRPPVAPGPVAPVEPAVPPAMQTQFTTLGSNAQGVVLLFRLPNEQFLKLHRNVFLNKMLQALGLVMADVVLVNV